MGRKKNEKIRRKDGGDSRQRGWLLDRIMRTNANSRSLRCGQAFICHALAAVYSRGQYGTYASRRFYTSCLTSNSSSSSATSARSRAVPLSLILLPRLAFSLKFPSDLGDRVPCHNYLPPSSPADTFVRGLRRRRRRRILLSTFLLIMQPCASGTLTI